jgi:hypothetical protein
MAQMTLGDYDAELIARGFDGFQTIERYRYINWGIEYIANKFPWMWEETTYSFTLAPGTFSVPLAAVLPNFRSAGRLIGTTVNFQRKLRVADEDDFLEKWLPLDLTQSSFRGEPSQYIVFENTLYVLPPPASSRDFVLHIHQRITDLTAAGQTPVTPPHLDEAVMLAALIRCHRRALEFQEAINVQAQLDDMLDDMRTDEEFTMSEQQDRVRPDNSWL